MCCYGYVSACGNEGREYLLGALDKVCAKAAAFGGGGGILKIRAVSPAVLKVSDNRGFMRFEQDIEIIYRGDMI